MDLITEEMMEERSEQKGKLIVRTRVIEIERDKNNFIGLIPRLATTLEDKIREMIVDAGEAENESDINVSAVLTIDTASTDRTFDFSLAAFRYMHLRSAVSTKRANVTVTMNRDKYQRDVDNQVTQTLSVHTIPFKDAKHVMEARSDNGAVLLEFRPISKLETHGDVVIKINEMSGWDEVISLLATSIGGIFIKQMQIYDLICVFRNIAFESATDAISEEGVQTDG